MDQITKYSLWILVLAISIYLIWTSWLFWHRLQKSKELIAHTAAFTASGNGLQILIAGDSTAVGIGADSPNQSIAGRIHHDFPRSSITNLGQSGLTAAALSTKLKAISPDQPYDLVVLQIGGNDIVAGTKLPQLAADLSQALAHANRLSSRVILMTSGNVGAAPIFPHPLRPLYHRRTLKARQMFMEQATQHHVHYVDLYYPPAEDPFLKDIPKFFAPDYFHPSGDGYGLWYQKLRPVLQNALSQSPTT